MVSMSRCISCVKMMYPIYRKNLDPIKNKANIKKCREREKEKRKSRPRRSLDVLWDTIKYDRRKGFDNDLDNDFVLNEILKPCVYCGENIKSRSLDRVDNNIGHLKSNVVTACFMCNFIRRDMPIDAWLKIAPSVRDAKNLGLFGNWLSYGGLRKK